VQVAVCNTPEVPEKPSSALLCVDEDELDDWWDALDVEAKADAFVQWSLGNDGRNSHVYIESRETKAVPVAGTVSEQDDDEGANFLRKYKHEIAKAMRKIAEAKQ
jgi:hypothetical protein